MSRTVYWLICVLQQQWQLSSRLLLVSLLSGDRTSRSKTTGLLQPYSPDAHQAYGLLALTVSSHFRFVMYSCPERGVKYSIQGARPVTLRHSNITKGLIYYMHTHTVWSRTSSESVVLKGQDHTRYVSPSPFPSCHSAMLQCRVWCILAIWIQRYFSCCSDILHLYNVIS